MVENANVKKVQYQTDFAAFVVCSISCMLQEASIYFRHKLQGRNKKWNCITTWHLISFEILTVLLQKIQAWYRVVGQAVPEILKDCSIFIVDCLVLKIKILWLFKLLTQTAQSHILDNLNLHHSLSSCVLYTDCHWTVYEYTAISLHVVCNHSIN